MEARRSPSFLREHLALFKMSELTIDTGSGPSLGIASDAERTSSRMLQLGIAGLSLAGVLAILYATEVGPWAFSDSAEYILAARNLVRGSGLGLIQASGDFEPLSLHPPLYPLALASGGYLGLDLVGWARWLNALLFGVTVSLAGWSIYRASRSRWLALGASALMVVHPGMVEIHSGAMSEPLYFATGFAGMLLLISYLERGPRWRLIAAGLMFGLAALARHPGLAFGGAGAIALLLAHEAGWKIRVRDAMLLAAVSALPLAIWELWLRGQPGVATRGWDFAVSNIWAALTPFRIELVEVIWDWIPFGNLLPSLEYRPKPRLILGAALLIATLAIFAARRIASRQTASALRVPAIRFSIFWLGFALLSLGILAGVFIFSQPALDRSDVDQRMLLPAQIAAILGGLVILDLIRRAWPRLQRTAWGVLALVLVLGSWYLPQTTEYLAVMHRSGAGYTSSTWRSSPTMKQVLALPSELPIISNESAALAFLIDRPSYNIPELINGTELTAFERFGEGATYEEEIYRQGGALVLFDTAFLHFYRIYEAATEERLAALVDGLALHEQTADGAIYFYELGSD